MAVIDINARFGAYPSRHRTASFEEVSSEAEALGIDSSCVCSTTGIFFSAHEGNLQTSNAAASQPQRLIPAATLNPGMSLDAGGAAEEIVAGPFRLARYFPDSQGWPIDFAPFRQSLSRFAERGLPVMITASRCGDATQLVRLIGGLPNKADGWHVILESVTPHTLAEAVAALRDAPDLMLETHSLRFADGLTRISEMIGAERLLFGSGAAAQSLGAALSYVRNSSLSEGDQAKVLGGNAASLLKL